LTSTKLWNTFTIANVSIKKYYYIKHTKYKEGQLMYCRNCGNQMEGQAAICVKCGAARNNGDNFCHNCGQATSAGAQVCVNCGVKLAGGDEQKSKLAAGLLGIFLGGLGIHRFYLGYTTMGIIQIVVSLITCGAGSIWGFIEGILILCGSTITKDAKGNPLKD
jgi:TM2 domain-containing membrane protein YozV/RNA polymerase subunit RPABC4/transcription elongation factor Spt4